MCAEKNDNDDQQEGKENDTTKIMVDEKSADAASTDGKTAATMQRRLKVAWELPTR